MMNHRSYSLSYYREIRMRRRCSVCGSYLAVIKARSGVIWIHLANNLPGVNDGDYPHTGEFNFFIGAGINTCPNANRYRRKS